MLCLACSARLDKAQNRSDFIVNDQTILEMTKFIVLRQLLLEQR